MEDNTFLPDLNPLDGPPGLALPDPLDCPRYDLFSQYRFTKLGAIGGLVLPVQTPCVDLLDFHRSMANDSVSLEYLAAPRHGYLQLQLRLHHHHKGEQRGKVDLLATHSWFSDEKPQFDALLNLIREATRLGYSPLWEMVRSGLLPDRFASVLQEEMPGSDEIYFKHLQFDQTKAAIQIGVLSVEQCLEPMGVRPSIYVRVKPVRNRNASGPVSFIKGVRR